MGGALHGTWLNDALVFLFAAGVLAPVLRLLRVPSVLAFLLAGVVLGPFGIGALAEHWPLLGHLTFSDPKVAEPFAEFGVLFLLFLLGTELSFEKLKSLCGLVFGAGGLQALVSVLAITLAVMLMGVEHHVALAIGLALALSSTAVVMQTLVEERRATGPVGRAALAVLLFQDMLVAPILILIGFLAQGPEANLFPALLEALIQGGIAVAFLLLFGRFVLKDAFRLAARAGGRDFLMGLTLLVIIGGAVLTASAGLSMALGAFLAGLLLGETEFKHQAEVDLEPFKGLLLGLFFMTVGLNLDLTTIWGSWPIVLGGLVLLLAAKAAIAAFALRAFGLKPALAIETAFLLAPASEFAFVVVTTATAVALFDSATPTLIAGIAGLSMLTTPLMARIGRALAARFEEKTSNDAVAESYPDLGGHVVIAGFGRVGRTIARILDAEEADIVALERNAEVVARERKAGRKIYLGDGSRPEILTHAGLAGASMLIVTVDDPKDAAAMVKAARQLRGDIPVLARARDAEHARELYAAGAEFVIPDAIEAGLQLAGRALSEFGYSSEVLEDRIASERSVEYQRAGTN
ncbi:cation:proton antiporter [Aminobacter sp. AP02]|uniref:cation:proton antiporter domain-containing protein n=1 Tax=Aminobacter sp. AP02 TaxID=2135737 RepID=UPI000D6D5BB3|nr:cation:proton antiporter [Aminobacter sp. AP02]PWK72578.1 Kef-type potassium/proton antiporter (CPA2 family) [Aminobacter sp. AP02]